MRGDVVSLTLTMTCTPSLTSLPLTISIVMYARGNDRDTLVGNVVCSHVVTTVLLVRSLADRFGAVPLFDILLPANVSGTAGRACLDDEARRQANAMIGTTQSCDAKLRARSILSATY